MSRRLTFALLAMVLVIGLSFPQLGSGAAPPKKVSIAVATEPKSVDVSFDSAGATGIVLENMNEFLFKKETNGELSPGLASWEVSPDGKVIECTLRKGVKFHSGDPLTTKDVVFTFERAREKNPWMKIKLRALDKIEVLDDFRFRFVLKTPDVLFIPSRCCTMIVSKSYYDRVGEDVFTRRPVGTGPYKFVDYQMGQYVDFERFEDYWGPKPSVKEARFYFISEDTTRVAKLQAGEVDLIQAVPFNMVNMIESDPNLKTVRLETNNPGRAVVFSTRNPDKPWYDKRVRLAMAYAINVDSIIKNVLYGIPKHWPWVAPGDLGYDPTVKHYPYDPQRAKELLAEAGYPNGFEFKFYWPTTARVPMASQVVQAIASYFEAVGIRTKLVGQEYEAFKATRRAAKKPTTDYVAYIGGSLTGQADPTDPASVLFACDGPTSAYCNPEFDKILAEARATIDDAKREELIKKLVKIMREEVPSIPIFDNVAVYGMQKNIDFVPTRKYFVDLVLAKDITVK